jgi:hypothetical protein
VQGCLSKGFFFCVFGSENAKKTSTHPGCVVVCGRNLSDRDRSVHSILLYFTGLRPPPTPLRFTEGVTDFFFLCPGVVGDVAALSKLGPCVSSSFHRSSVSLCAGQNSDALGVRHRVGPGREVSRGERGASGHIRPSSVPDQWHQELCKAPRLPWHPRAPHSKVSSPLLPLQLERTPQLQPLRPSSSSPAHVSCFYTPLKQCWYFLLDVACFSRLLT